MNVLFLDCLDAFYRDDGEYYALQEYEGRHVCKYSIKIYRRMLKAQVNPFFEKNYPNLKASEITPEILNHFFKSLMMQKSSRGTPFAPSYIMKYKALFTTIIKWMIHNNKNFDFNFNQLDLKIKAKEKQHRGILTEEEQEKLLKYKWKSRKAYIAFILAINTGLRPGELRALTINDLEDGYIKVRKAYNDVDGIKTTKTMRARLVPCDQEVINMLKQYVMTIPEEANFIFYDKKNPSKPVSRDYFILNLYRAMEKCGIQKERYNAESDQIETIVWYSLRHQTATRWVESGLDIRLIARCMGHSTIQLQQRYANHFYENQIKNFGNELKASGFLSVRSSYCL